MTERTSPGDPQSGRTDNRHSQGPVTGDGNTVHNHFHTSSPSDQRERVQPGFPQARANSAQPPEQGQTSRPHFYVVLALILLAGGCLAISSTGSDEPTSGSGAATSTAAPYTGGITYAPNAAPLVSLPPPVPNYEQTWAGRLRITDQRTNIGLQPPQAVGPMDNYQLTWSRNSYLFSISNKVGVWTDTATDPTYEQCRAAQTERSLSSKEKSRIPYVKGRGYCMSAQSESAGHATVFLRFVENDGEGVVMEGIRWSDQE